MKRLVNDFHTNPLIALAYSAMGILVGTTLHFMRVMFQISVTTAPHETLDLMVKYFQLFAYFGGGLAGFVAGHTWMVKQTWYQKMKFWSYTFRIKLMKRKKRK